MFFFEKQFCETVECLVIPFYFSCSTKFLSNFDYYILLLIKEHEFRFKV